MILSLGCQDPVLVFRINEEVVIVESLNGFAKCGSN